MTALDRRQFLALAGAACLLPRAADAIGRAHAAPQLRQLDEYAWSIAHHAALPAAATIVSSPALLETVFNPFPVLRDPVDPAVFGTPGEPFDRFGLTSAETTQKLQRIVQDARALRHLLAGNVRAADEAQRFALGSLLMAPFDAHPAINLWRQRTLVERSLGEIAPTGPLVAVALEIGDREALWMQELLCSRSFAWLELAGARRDSEPVRISDRVLHFPSIDVLTFWPLR